MIVRRDNKWKAAFFKITLSNKGIEEVHYSDSKAYYNALAEKHPEVEIITIEDFEPAGEVKDRILEIEDYPAQYHAELAEYVETGTSSGTLLENLILKKKNKMLEEAVELLIMDSLEV